MSKLKEQKKEEEKYMKKLIIGKAIAKAAYKESEKQINEICNAFFYQPKLPEAVKKLKKTNVK